MIINDGFSKKNDFPNVIIAISVILLISFLLRIYDIGGESFWRDEIYSVKTADMDLAEIFKSKDMTPPMYYMILHIWQKVFGRTEVSVRLLSVVFGMLSIVLGFLIGKMVGNKQTGVLSALFLGISTMHIHYSQEARAYTLMFFLSLLSIYYYLKLINDRRPSYWIGYVISTSILTYSHVYSVFIIIAQNIHFFSILLYSRYSSRLKFRDWLFAQLAVSILFLPWVSILFQQTSGAVKKGFWIPSVNINTLINTLIKYAGNQWLLILFSGLIVIKALSTIKIYLLKKNHANRDAQEHLVIIWLLLLILIIPIIAPYIISEITTPIYFYRYTIAASAAFFILAAAGLREIGSTTIKMLLALFIVGLSFMNVWQNYYEPIMKEQWRETAAIVEKNYKPGDVLVFSTSGSVDAFQHYSKNKEMPMIPYFSVKNSLDRTIHSEEIDKIFQNNDRVWTILLRAQRAKSADIKNVLSKSHSLTEAYLFEGIEVSTFER